MSDLIQFSDSTPLWVSFALLIGRSVAIVVTTWWAVSMLRSLPLGLGRQRPWRWPWPWCLSLWLVAVDLTILVNWVRVLTAGHLRARDAIGDGVRVVELVGVINLAAWSIVAFVRWRNPPLETSTDDRGIDAPSKGEMAARTIDAVERQAAATERLADQVDAATLTDAIGRSADATERLADAGEAMSTPHPTDEGG